MSKPTVSTVGLLPTGLIDNLPAALKYYVVWFLALIAALPEIMPLLQAAMPSVFGTDFTAGWYTRVTQGLAILGIISRFVKQTKPTLPVDPNAPSG